MCYDRRFSDCFGIEFCKSRSGKYRVFQYRRSFWRFIGMVTPIEGKQGWIFKHRDGSRSRFPVCSAVTRVQAVRKSMECELIKYPRYNKLPRFPKCDCLAAKNKTMEV